MKEQFWLKPFRMWEEFGHTFMSCAFFRNVKAIPPVMIILLTLFKRFLINWILSWTLALWSNIRIASDTNIRLIYVTYPPKMAMYGLFGSPMTLPKYSNSFFINSPAALTGWLIPTIELYTCTEEDSYCMYNSI